MLMTTLPPQHHWVRMERYGDRLMTIAELRMRQELAAMIAALPKMGNLRKLSSKAVGIHLANRLRSDYGFDDLDQLDTDKLESAYFLVKGLTTRAEQFGGASYDDLVTFVREVIGGSKPSLAAAKRPPKPRDEVAAAPAQTPAIAKPVPTGDEAIILGMTNQLERLRKRLPRDRWLDLLQVVMGMKLLVFDAATVRDDIAAGTSPLRILERANANQREAIGRAALNYLRLHS